MFGGSKLQASGLQKGPLATAKQHLIACRNRAQTYPQKLPLAPSELLEKYLFFSVSSWLQAASIRLAEVVVVVVVVVVVAAVVSSSRRSSNTSSSLTRSPLRRPGSADI